MKTSGFVSFCVTFFVNVYIRVYGISLVIQLRNVFILIFISLKQNVLMKGAFKTYSSSKRVPFRGILGFEM